MTGIYGLIHMAVDLSCAFLMYAFVVGGEHWYIWLLAYNFCAFALQMPIGAGADRLDRNSLVAAGGCGGVLCGLVLAMAGMPAMASVIAGIGNACFHVGGGIDVMNRSGTRAALLGMFVAPGALGIVLGSSIVRYGNRITEGTMRVGTALALAMAVSAAAICVMAERKGIWRRSGNAPVTYGNLSFSQRMAVLCFLGTVILRSYSGMVQDFPWKEELAGSAWFLVCAVVLGKMAGGVLADCMGVEQATQRSMCAAAAGFLCQMYPLTGILGVFCWNMSMPLTLWAVSGLFPGAKGFGVGLLTFGLFVGFCPVYLAGAGIYTGGAARAAASPAGMAVMAILSMLLLTWGIRQVRE